ncbi:aldo/keto reductase [Camillea tinctor]|nr:aldo/keto reductase [Camillea tinctor]
MRSVTSTSKPNASVTPPRQTEVIPKLTMNDGYEIPMFAYGLGTALYKGTAEEIVPLATMAIKNGYYHLDCAESYGNEAHLGAAIAASGVPRSELFVTTKLRGTKKQDVNAAFEKSLKRLGLEYVDLYLIHAPHLARTREEMQSLFREKNLFNKYDNQRLTPDILAQWAQMEQIRASGRARSIGVSNFLQEHLEAVLETAQVPPAINQIEYHPYLQHGELIPFHREKGIAVAAYAPLTAVTKAKPGPVDDVYARLAGKYGVTEGDVALRWCLDQGIVTITTSSSEDRLQGYMNKLPSFKLTPREVDEVAQLGRQKHYRGFWKNHFADDDTR